MDGAQIAVVLSALAAVGTAYNGYVTSRSSNAASKDTESRERLELAFTMSEKHTTRLETQLDDLSNRLDLESKRALLLDQQLQECKAGRHQLEVQVEILRLQMGKP